MRRVREEFPDEWSATMAGSRDYCAWSTSSISLYRSIVVIIIRVLYIINLLHSLFPIFTQYVLPAPRIHSHWALALSGRADPALGGAGWAGWAGRYRPWLSSGL